MAYSAFGATAAILASDLMPNQTLGATSSPSTTNIDARIIPRRAARVSGLVDALGLDSSALDSTDEPISYWFLQRLVLVGTAVDVALAFTGQAPDGEMVDAWRDEWQDGLAALSDPRQAKVLLVDALTTTSPLLLRTHIQHGGQTPSTSGDIEVDDPIFVRDMDL